MRLSQYLLGPVIALGLSTGCNTGAKAPVKGKQQPPAAATDKDKDNKGKQRTGIPKPVAVADPQPAATPAPAPAPAATPAPAPEPNPENPLTINWRGPLPVDGSNPVALAEAPRIAKVHGDLVYNIGGLETVDMPELQEVTGNVRIGVEKGTGNQTIKHLRGLSNLRTIGGKLFITGNVALEDLAGLDNLQSVQEVVIESNPSLTKLDGFDKLQNLQAVHIGHNVKLQEVGGFTALTHVEGAVSVHHNEALTDLHGLSKVASINGALMLTHNAKLQALGGLSSLASVGDLHVNHNKNLASLNDLAALETAQGEVEISHNAILGEQGTVSLGKLTSAHALKVEHNGAMTDLQAPALKELNSVVVRGNAKLGEIKMPQLTVQGEIQIGEDGHEGTMTPDQIAGIRHNMRPKKQ